jgi:deoxyribonuclease V
MRFDSVEEVPDLWKETYDLVAQVPRGRVTTYGEVAKALGDIAASRFVGLAMSKNSDIVRVPCRRVVRSDGYVGGYTGGGPEKKIRLLMKEGIEIVDSKVMDLDKVLFTGFRTDYPLRRLRRRQLTLKRLLDLRKHAEPFEKVAGIDVAYADEHAYAAMVVFDFETGEEIERHVIEGDAKFPYVPTYLAFREIPVIKPLMKGVDDRTVVMFDGNGTLHPEGFGVTSQIGVVFEVATVGIAKKLLCGEVSGRLVNHARPVTMKGEVIGHALSRDARTGPVFVSAGNRVSQEQARDIALRFLKHRVPEPTRLAHIAAGAARRAANSK